ncbi:MAG: hypothetical protein GXY02_08375 [Actinobacteria bacterium]|nr:hypothetical protein [Actinomycetota bacterium]OPZ41905.1 MAG: hypothetical protein BWY94_02278 [Actinobacteria bacterium ADurb.BinA094]
MTRGKLKPEKPDWKALLADDADLMRVIVRDAVQRDAYHGVGLVRRSSKGGRRALLWSRGLERRA